ncbi:MAG: hypothetical protein WD077_00750 [Bacteroidia bacterium]
MKKIKQTFLTPLLFLFALTLFASCKRETGYIISVNNRASYDVIMEYVTSESKDTITMIVPRCEPNIPLNCNFLPIYSDTAEGALGGMSFGVFRQKLHYMHLYTFDTSYVMIEDLDLTDINKYTHGTTWDGRTETHEYKLSIGDGHFEEK